MILGWWRRRRTRFAKGGTVQQRTTDSIPAYLSDGMVLLPDGRSAPVRPGETNAEVMKRLIEGDDQ